MNYIKQIDSVVDTVVVKSPEPMSKALASKKPSVFLAGSIEMGEAEDWQLAVTTALRNEGCVVLNPRRDQWDSTWAQTEDNPQFNEQVTWELDALEKADVIAFYFCPGTKSPITLLELGLYADSGKAVVCCPRGFWRKGNVDIVCTRHDIEVADDIMEMVESVKRRLSEAKAGK